MPRVVAITQARMTSTRLPGKVLKVTRGKSLLGWHIERLKCCPLVDEIVIATTVNATDEPLVALAHQLGVRCFRGPEDDVLSRFVGAAREAKAEIVVRVTSDCPLWDPAEGARVIDALSTTAVDYASNGQQRSYPRGLDTEALWRDVLERLDRLAPRIAGPEREHVTYMVHASRPALFLRHSVTGEQDNSDLRWCVDTPADFACIDSIYSGLADPLAPFPDVLRFVRAHPEIARLNAEIEQKKV